MNKLIMGVIASFFVAAVFFAASSISYLAHLANLEWAKEKERDPFLFGRVVLPYWYYLQYVLVYGVIGAIAGSIGLILLRVNRRRQVI